MHKRIANQVKRIAIFSKALSAGKAYALARFCMYRFILARKVPYSVYLELTFKCQLSCRHCVTAAYPAGGPELSTRDWKRAIDRLSDLGVPRIHFSGGEPLLREDLEDLVFYAHRKHIFIGLDTNGWDLTVSRIRNLKESGLDFICISLNGQAEESHDAWCARPGSFQRVADALKNCRQEHVPCVISTVARKDLVRSGELRRIFELADKWGSLGVRLNAPHAMGRWLERPEEALSAQEKAHLERAFSVQKAALLGEGPYERLCRASLNYSLAVSPDGEIQTCAYIPYSFGNILREDLRAILRRIYRHEMFRKKSCCKIEDEDFRKRYIETIKPDTQLPIRLY
ncbi:MAG: radical SAM protein [Candidatus Omnitrophica bacterium]|nr:radical SAM protein [Candidatus Omnitrophota bacterium]